MTEIYWITEYVKVFVAYLLLLFVWPSVVFRSFLRGKSKSFRFSFCVTAQILVINMIVLLLGLFHCLNAWVVNILFWGVPLLSLAGSVRRDKKEYRILKRLITGTYGKKLFVMNTLSSAGKKGKECLRIFCSQMRLHWAEYIVLGMVLLYGLIYFSYGVFHDHTYGFSDLYTHHEWIYQLTRGTVFADGIYPEAMHCFVYLLHTMFGIRIYSCMLYLQSIHVAVLLLSAYILAKEVFMWRFTPIFAVAAFLVVEVKSPNQIYSMSRLQCTLPQEFGLHTLFLCAAFLIRYLHSSERARRRKKETKGYWDGNLLVFGMAFAASLTIHFYPTIMAFFVCVSFVAVSLKHVFCRRRFLPLAVAVLLGFFVAVLPMTGALAAGMPFQASMDWAMSVVEGGEEQSGLRLQDSGEGAESGDTKAGRDAGVNAGEGGSGAAGVEAAPAQKTALSQKTGNTRRGIADTLKQKAGVLFDDGYTAQFGAKRTGWIMIFTAAALIIGGVGSAVTAIGGFPTAKRKKYNLYIGAVISSVVFVALGCMRELGLPELVEHSRLGAVTQLLVLFVMAIPVDFLFSMIRMAVCEGIVKLLSVCCVAGIYVGASLMGIYHGYLYFELSRYNEAAFVTEAIINTLPENSYTVVSTVDDLYMLIQYGRHEELIDFINNSYTEDYRIPTEYVFLFVEKRPIEEYQIHFFTGPKWLARNGYADLFGDEASRCPEVFASQISQEAADTPLYTFPNTSKLYLLSGTRTILQSKAYAWCEEFSRLYPNELKTYFESDNFVCYYFKQNVNFVYDLAIMDKGGD